MFQVRCQGYIEVSRGSFPTGIKDVSTQVNWTGCEMRMGDTFRQVKCGKEGWDIIWASWEKKVLQPEEPFGKAPKLSS